MGVSLRQYRLRNNTDSTCLRMRGIRGDRSFLIRNNHQTAVIGKKIKLAGAWQRYTQSFGREVSFESRFKSALEVIKMFACFVLR